MTAPLLESHVSGYPCRRGKVRDVYDLGDRLVMLASVPMRAQASGIRLTEEFALVTTIKDGMVFRVHEYYDHDEALREALEAAGLAQPQSSRS